jgi:hypothetical protein
MAIQFRQTGTTRIDWRKFTTNEDYRWGILLLVVARGVGKHAETADWVGAAASGIRELVNFAYKNEREWCLATQLGLLDQSGIQNIASGAADTAGVLLKLMGFEDDDLRAAVVRLGGKERFIASYPAKGCRLMSPSPQRWGFRQR